jgi:uncharacterized membrane protein (UPF0127 family)
MPSLAEFGASLPAVPGRAFDLRLAAAFGLAAILVLTGCSPLPIRTVTLGGETWRVYEGGPDGMRGLPGFGEVDGMLFDMGDEVDPSAVPFVMDGVRFPIDIAWFDATGALVSTGSMSTCQVGSCPLYHAGGPYRWAIEAPVGAFADLRPEDRLVVED